MLESSKVVIMTFVLASFMNLDFPILKVKTEVVWSAFSSIKLVIVMTTMNLNW